MMVDGLAAGWVGFYGWYDTHGRQGDKREVKEVSKDQWRLGMLCTLRGCMCIAGAWR